MSEKLTFRKGQAVTRVLVGAGVTSKEPSVVARVSKGQVWLDNGPGNDESGPFNADTGRREGFALMDERIEVAP